MIALSVVNIPACYDLLHPFLGFWSAEFNAFIFSWGMLTPTLLDVASIIGMPLSGKSMHAYAILKKVKHGYVHARGFTLPLLARTPRPKVKCPKLNTRPS